MKLVWILRNLVKTSYSNYWHYIRIGKESLTFKNCLLQEPVQKKGNLKCSMLAYYLEIHWFLINTPDSYLLLPSTMPVSVCLRNYL